MSYPQLSSGAMRPKAASLAIRFQKQGLPADFDTVRDAVDQATGGELDTTQLDILASMVTRRLEEPKAGA